MQREHVLEAFVTPPAPAPARHNRSASVSGEYHHSAANQFMRPPPRVSPEPQFIAASSASQIVTADQGLNLAEDRPENDVAVVSPRSLGTLNAFLDNILFNILLTARSTKLTAIRPALSDVLKPRLAKEVISAADEELSEYMAAGDEEEMSEFRGGFEPHGRFDLDRSWKLTRLRCMVYTRLGDMEEEDEEEHLRREGLNTDSIGSGRFSNNIGHITPAAAIFLTSILEYIGEHSLIIAGEAASSRINARFFTDSQEGLSGEPQENSQTLVVEEIDMEKIALNPTLGRLWRTWKKNMKTSRLSRTLSRESLLRRGHGTFRLGSRHSSITTVEDVAREIAREPTVSEIGEQVDPADIPLPLNDHDVDEIEVPGFTSALAIAVPARSVRPRSLFVPSLDLGSPRSTGRSSPASAGAVPSYRTHTRSASLPNKAYASASFDNVFTCPGSATESQSEQLESMPERDEIPDPADDEEVETPKIPQRSSERDGKYRAKQDTEQDSLHVSDIASDPRSDDISVASGHTDVDEIAWLQSQPGSHQLNEPMNMRGYGASTDSLQNDIPESNVATAVSKAQVVDKPRAMSEEFTKAKLVTIPQKRESLRARESPSNQMSDNKRQGPIVETSFVPEPNRAGSQPTLRGPIRESIKDANARPSYPSPRSRPNASPNLSDTQSVSAESDKSQMSRIHSRKTTKSSVGESRHVPPTPTSAGTERAGVQRVSPPPTPRDPAYRAYQQAKPRRSESIGSYRERRPVTSGSTTSQVSSKIKGIVRRESNEPEHQVPLPLRTSSDTNGAQSKFGNESVTDASDLDQLIQSDETIHYTLTPRNMREMEDPTSPRWAPNRGNATAQPTGSVQDRRHVDARNDPRNHNTSLSSSSYSRPSKASNLNPPSRRKGSMPEARDARIASESVQDFADFIKSTGPNSKPSPRRKGSTPEARDARVASDSVRDFADFIKSTGPLGTTVVPTGGGGSRVTNSANGSPRTGAAYPKSPNGAVSPISTGSKAHSTLSNGALMPKKTGPRMQARAAATPKDDGTSELIDFIREGPPKSSSHRISRAVAPFRSTVDSDEFRLGPSRVDRDGFTHSSATSTRGSSAVTKSSINSRTGLVESANRANNRQTRGAQPFAAGAQSGDMPIPRRKQRRVRDPYAIDTDSEDEDLVDSEEPRGIKTHQEEESLIDFLRNAPPPSNDEPPQPFSINMNHVNGGSDAAKPRSKSTASTVRSRLMRTSSVDKAPSTKLSRTSLRSHKSNFTSPPTTGSKAPALPKLDMSSRSISESQDGNYTPKQSTYPSQAPWQQNNPAKSLPRVPLDDLRGRETGTSSLADFLKNTGPPEPPPPRSRSPVPSIPDEKQRWNPSFSRMFLRKKKEAF